MKIGFFTVGEKYIDMARVLIESAQAAMPGVEIWHLTDGECPSLPECKTLRLRGDMPMAIRRMSLHAMCEGDWLFVDTDIIIRKDVSDVFAQTFDVALTDRIGTITNESAYAAVMPYNIGVTFSRSPKFWIAVRTLLFTAPPKFQEWEGDQRVIAGMMATGHRYGFDVGVIPGRTYNYPPKHDGDGEHASILHYKGQRKQWLKKVA